MSTYGGGGAWSCLGGNGSIVSDASAPVSPPSVLRFDFTGVVGGSSPDSCTKTFTATDRIYVAFYWKASSGFQTHAAGTKISFVVSPSFQQDIIPLIPAHLGVTAPWPIELYNANNILINNCDAGVPYFGDCPGSVHWFPSGFPSANIQDNTWYLHELLMCKSSTTSSNNGRLRYWLTPAGGSSTLMISTDQMDWASGGFDQVALNATWGGTGGTSPTQYFYWDAYKISIPPASACSGTPPPPPPPPPVPPSPPPPGCNCGS